MRLGPGWQYENEGRRVGGTLIRASNPGRRPPIDAEDAGLDVAVPSPSERLRRSRPPISARHRWFLQNRSEVVRSRGVPLREATRTVNADDPLRPQLEFSPRNATARRGQEDWTHALGLLIDHFDHFDHADDGVVGMFRFEAHH